MDDSSYQTISPGGAGVLALALLIRLLSPSNLNVLALGDLPAVP